MVKCSPSPSPKIPRMLNAKMQIDISQMSGQTKTSTTTAIPGTTPVTTSTAASNSSTSSSHVIENSASFFPSVAGPTPPTLLPLLPHLKDDGVLPKQLSNYSKTMDSMV